LAKIMVLEGKLVGECRSRHTPWSASIERP
jgi:hypothetical protein